MRFCWGRSSSTFKSLVVVLISALGTGLAGCDQIAKVFDRAGTTLKTEIQNSPRLNSRRAQRAQANAEVLAEVFHIVWMRKPSSKQEFGQWLDVFNQGATLEGIYNGFTRSSYYRSLEQSKSQTNAKALDAFVKILFELQMELPFPTKFDSRSGKPLEQITNPGLQAQELAPGVSAIEFNPTKPKALQESDRDRITRRYQGIFESSSIFTLKRVLGAEALRVFEQKTRAGKTQLGEWYPRWVIEMGKLGIDFGLEQRNFGDPGFHKNWVLQATRDKIQWEILNRVHRVMNEYYLAQES